MVGMLAAWAGFSSGQRDTLSISVKAVQRLCTVMACSTTNGRAFLRRACSTWRLESKCGTGDGTKWMHWETEVWVYLSIKKKCVRSLIPAAGRVSEISSVELRLCFSLSPLNQCLYSPCQSAPGAGSRPPVSRYLSDVNLPTADGENRGPGNIHCAINLLQQFSRRLTICAYSMLHLSRCRVEGVLSVSPAYNKLWLGY